MSPRPAVGEVSIAIEGSPPCPPGKTMSLPKVGLPPALCAADAGRTIAAAASTASTSKRAERTRREPGRNRDELIRASSKFGDPQAPETGSVQYPDRPG